MPSIWTKTGKIYPLISRNMGPLKREKSACMAGPKVIRKFYTNDATWSDIEILNQTATYLELDKGRTVGWVVH